MTWRTVVISKHAKVDYKLNQLVIRDDSSQVKINICEIATVIFENTAVALTAYALAELVKNKINVVFCDHNRFPLAELVPFNGTSDVSVKVKKQMEWSEVLKTEIWTEIVRRKINNQYRILKYKKTKNSELLLQHIDNVEVGDLTNREAVAAKVYFSDLFGLSFNRNESSPINSALDYGYTLVLSLISREISSAGYLTHVGIHHHNVFNFYNLASDLIEILRIIVDHKVISMNLTKFDTEEKHELVKILQAKVKIEKEVFSLNSAVKYFCQSVFKYLNSSDCGDISQIKWIEYEL